MADVPKARVEEAQELLEAKDKGLIYRLPCALDSDVVMVNRYNDYLSAQYVYIVSEKKMTLDMLSGFDKNMTKDRQVYFFSNLARALNACAEFAAQCPGIGRVMRYGTEAIQKAAESILCGQH